MNSFESIQKISKTNLIYHDLKWCFVNEKKQPFQFNGDICRLNIENNFSTFENLLNKNVYKFKGIGISVNFSKIYAIDIDKCVKIPNDINSLDNRGKEILELFKDYYCEFSFSGTGLRILFLGNLFDELNNLDDYYIKNSNNHIEFYTPRSNSRYVTVTGNYIYNNKLKTCNNKTIINFLNKYMKREKKEIKSFINNEEVSQDELDKRFKKLWFTNSRFQEVWCSKAPGSGKNESELDYYLIVNLYQNVTQDINKIKSLIEESDYYLSKDYKHKNKWNNTKYVYETYENIKRR